jgi:hypothetical protein
VPLLNNFNKTFLHLQQLGDFEHNSWLWHTASPAERPKSCGSIPAQQETEEKQRRCIGVLADCHTNAHCV